MSWEVSLFVGLVYMFTPQLIVLPNVGHGSKLFTASYIPLILLTTKRLMERRKLFDFALFALAVGMTLLSLHVQMAFYALLAGGMYLLWDAIFDIKKQPLNIPLKFILFFGGLAIGLAFAAKLYFPIYEYTPFSIRGGTEGGLNWEYATNWSFHPLESFTYLIPSFFGFGGETYWGYMPFTDMPLYWGMATLILVILTLIYVRNRNATYFIFLFAFAWIISFGKFFPILYKPFFELMPFFNKFRVPVMIQILVVLASALLAGLGLERLKEIAGTKRATIRKFLYTLFAVIGLAILASLLYVPLKSAIVNWAQHNRPQFSPEAGGAIFGLWFGDLWKSAGFSALVLGLIYAFLQKKLRFPPLCAGLSLLLILDLWIVNSKLISPIPHSYVQAYLEPTPAVRYLQKQEKPFRIFPLDRFRPQNWYGYFGLENIDGYMGTKMKRYQDALDGIGLNSLNLVNILNAKYLLTDRELEMGEMLQKVEEGKQKVYLNRGALPRAWMVHKLITLPKAEDRFEYIKRFNPWLEAVVEEEIELSPAEEQGLAQVTNWTPLEIKVKTISPSSAFLVLSEIYYPPYWKANIDGQNTKIYPTNQLLRGVSVPAGEHTVTFKCQSMSYKIGSMVHNIAFTGILIVLIIGAYPLIRQAFKHIKK
jgi:hypothetical protein